MPNTVAAETERSFGPFTILQDSFSHLRFFKLTYVNIYSLQSAGHKPEPRSRCIDLRTPYLPSSLRKNLEIGALAVFLPRVLGRSGCCEQTLTYAVSSLGMRVRL